MYKSQVVILDEFSDDISAVCQEVIDLRKKLDEAEEEIGELKDELIEANDNSNA